MAYTYSKLATYAVGSSGVTSIDFINIPQTYTDLVIRLSSRTDRVATNADCYMIFNNDNNTSNYTAKKIYGVPTSSGSQSAPVRGIGTSNGASNTSNTFASTEIYIPNYTGINYKSYSVDAVQEQNDTTTNAYATLFAGLWSSTSPITSIRLFIEESRSWVQYTTAHLYGIKAEV